MVVNDRTSDGLYPFEAFYIPDRFAKKAEDELKETPETREDGILQLRELVLSKSPSSMWSLSKIREYNLAPRVVLENKLIAHIYA